MAERMMAGGYSVPDLTGTIIDAFERSGSISEFRLACETAGIDLSDGHVRSTVAAAFPDMVKSIFPVDGSEQSRDRYCGRIVEMLGTEWAMLDSCCAAELRDVIDSVVDADLAASDRLSKAAVRALRRHVCEILDEIEKHVA